LTAINRVKRLREFGVFHDFTWPVELPNFGRYNLIYGWNGSGKTTLSGLFRALEMRSVPDTGQATLTIADQDVVGADFTQSTLPVRVFNREFIENSVFPISGGDVPPIFVVGSASVEKQKEVERLKEEQIAGQAILDAARSKKREADGALDRYCIDGASVIREMLRSAGTSQYNNYDKSNFLELARKMLSDGDAAAHLLGDKERQKLLTQHLANPKSNVGKLTYELPALQPLANAVDELLSTSITSIALETLKDDPALSGWVHDGLGIHRERGTDRCFFCEQPLPPERISALEAHFNEEYENLISNIQLKSEEIQSALKALSELIFPAPTELYDDLRSEYENGRDAIRRALDTTKDFLDLLLMELAKKRERVFEHLVLGGGLPKIDTGVVGDLNEVLDSHNQANNEFQSRTDEARLQLESNSVAESLEEFVELGKAAQRSNAAVDAADLTAKRLVNAISQLELEIVEHRPPAEQLNLDLAEYLGHDELKLEVKDSGYSIMRHGVPAEALSEGEETALALLYFLKSLRDRRFDLSNGVVVLDDPVSSLDSNALFLAFGFIRERTEDAAQLIILTHNFTFFRQVRNWFHFLKDQRKKDVSKRPARFYMLECIHDGTQRSAHFRPLDPLLEKFESEYHYLFAQVYHAAMTPASQSLGTNYILPNMARRLMEAFLAFRQPDIVGHLAAKVENVDFDNAKKIRIIRFLHTHSHGDAVGEPEHDPSLLGEANTVLKDLLELMKSQDPKHYAGMEKLVSQPGAEDDDE